MKKNHVAYILDRSSSMENIRDATINSFNEQIEATRIASRGQQADISLFTFSTEPDVPQLFTVPLEQVPKLTRETYAPNGWTALYDTVLEATRLLGNLPDANDPETSFLVIIQSDGEENRSKASGTEVSARLEALQATNRWTFTYLGCDRGDLTRLRAMGISAGNSRAFAYSNDGMALSGAVNCSASSNYFAARAAGETSVNNLYDVAEAQLGVQLDPNAQVVVSGTVQGTGLIVNTTNTISVVTPSLTADSKLVVKKDDTNPPATT